MVHVGYFEGELVLSVGFVLHHLDALALVVECFGETIQGNLLNLCNVVELLCEWHFVVVLGVVELEVEHGIASIGLKELLVTLSYLDVKACKSTVASEENCDQRKKDLFHNN